MGRKKKSKSSEAASVQHRPSGWSPPVPIIIFDMPPEVFTTTKELFKDHVQLHTGSPKTQAAAAARLGCPVPPRRSPYGYRPSPSHPPQPANAIPDPSLATAIVPFRHNEERHHAVSASFVSDDYATTSYGAGVAMASADALSPPSLSSILNMLNTHLMSESDDDLHNIASTSNTFVPDSSLAVNADPFQQNEEVLLAAGGQNTQQYSSYVPPNFQHNQEGHLTAATPYAASASIVSDHHATTSTTVFPPSSSSIWDTHTAQLMSHGELDSIIASAFTPSSSSLLDKKNITNLRGSGSNDLIFTFPTGAAVHVSNGNVFAGAAPAPRPSTPTKIAASNSDTNVVDKFLQESDDNVDWSWIFDDHIL